MRSIVLGAIVGAGLSLVSAVPTVSAPANVAAIGQAAADIGTVSQVRCWCTWRGWRGCRRWRCWWCHLEVAAALPALNAKQAVRPRKGRSDRRFAGSM